MRTPVFIVLFLAISLASWAQEIKTNADKYFYGYAYSDAIKEYQKDMQKGIPLSNYQFLNLADSYFKTSDYSNASKLYLEVYRKDTIMSNNRFNNMLQSLAKTSEPERVKAFMKSKGASLSSELMENANFNYELLEAPEIDNANFKIITLPINSPQADFGPSFYKDKLLFSSSRKAKSKKVYGPSGESYMDIYVGRIGNSGKVYNPNRFDGIPKSPYHKATPFYSSEQRTLFYILSNEEDGELTFDDKGKNSLAIGLVPQNGTSRFVLKDLSTSFYYPFYDAGSDRLYFAANFPDGYGGTDLYYVHTNNMQVMSEPINLGPRINTPGNEIAPFFHEGSLYFSSDIFYGKGGMDVYKANLQSDDSYSTPVNLGTGINSKADDFGFIVKNDQDLGYIGYFSSNRKGGIGNDDVYGFTISRTPGLKTLLFKGQVTNSKSGEGISGASVQLYDKEGSILKEIFTRADGNYQLEVPWRDEVTLRVYKSRHSMFSSFYQGTALDAVQKSPLNIEIAAVSEVVEEKEGQTVLRLDDFVFERGKSNIDAVISAQLDKVVAAVGQFPQIRLRIENHTDSRGSTSSNKRISQTRVNGIKAYLLKKGVPAENISSVIGYGEERILNSCKNGVYCLDFLHDQNARTQFVVLNYEDLNQ